MKKLVLVLVGVLICTYSWSQSELPAKSDFVGVYKMNGGPVQNILVTFDNNVLMAEAVGVGKSEILETKVANEFDMPKNKAKMTFIRNEKNEVSNISVSVSGMVLEGIKEANPLKEYAGIYVFEDGSPVNKVVVVFENGKLFGNSDQGKAELKPSTAKDSFEVVGFEGTATFSRNDSSEVNNVVLKVQGMTMNGTRK